MLLCFRWNHKTSDMKGLMSRKRIPMLASVLTAVFLTLNDFPPQTFWNVSDISDTNPFFQRAYLLESSPPKKLECGAYCLAGFSSTSSWLNNPEGRRQFSNVNSTVLDDWTTGIYSIMKSECVCVLWNADSKHQYISGGCCLQSCFYLPLFSEECSYKSHWCSLTEPNYEPDCTSRFPSLQTMRTEFYKVVDVLDKQLKEV